MVVVRFRRLILVALFAALVLAGRSSSSRAEESAAPLTPQDVLDRLASALVADDSPPLGPLLAPSQLRIHVRRPAGGDIGDDAQTYGPEQVAVLLREYLDSVEMRPFDPEAGERSRPFPDRRVWVETPRPDPRAKGSPHGILHVSVRSDEEGAFEHQRLYVGLRETAGGWKVEKILHLP